MMPPPIPTGRDDRGGGDIEGGGTVEACRPWASVCQKGNIAEKGGLEATPLVSVKRGPNPRSTHT